MDINIKDKCIKKMIWSIGPVFIGDGVITILNRSNRLNRLIMGLFIANIVAVICPTLSKLSNENNKEKLAEAVIQSVNTVLLLIIAISIEAIVLAEPVVKIVFKRGAFNSRATHMTAIALARYSIGMIGFGLRDILRKVFYSLKYTRTPMVNTALVMGLNIVLNFIFIEFLGYLG